MVLGFDQVMKIVREFAQKASEAKQVSKVYLFGSYARGEATDNSDIDVCFFLNSYEGKNKIDVTVDLFMIAHNNWNLDIQPVVYLVTDLDNPRPFLLEVLRTGIEIWPAMCPNGTRRHHEIPGSRQEFVDLSKTDAL